jgi:diaminopimelate decarboxylase
MRIRTLLKGLLGPVLRRWLRRSRQLPPSLWRLIPGSAGGLSLRGHALGELAATHGTPLHVYDVRALRSNVRAMAGVEVFYSYKTHPLPAVLQDLHSQGVGAEVISELELDLALRLGVPPERIIYNGPAKSERSLYTAIRHGILLLNLNHREELDPIVRIARELGCRVRLGIRVTGGWGWTGQFGTPIAGDAALRLFETVLAQPEIDLVGLHAHRGALIHQQHELDAYLDELLAFVDRLHARLGWSPELLDVGGSLGVASVQTIGARALRLARGFGVPIDAPDLRGRLSPAAYTGRLRQRVSEHFLSVARPVPRIVVEPGRAVTGNAQMLITRVVSLRELDDDSGLAILDAGINLASILAYERHQIFSINPPEPGVPLRRYRLVGPICQPGDVIAQALMLPALKVGDCLVIMDAGAYFEADSTVFSFPRPATLRVDGAAVQVARRAETAADIFARDRWGSETPAETPAETPLEIPREIPVEIPTPKAASRPASLPARRPSAVSAGR